MSAIAAKFQRPLSQRIQDYLRRLVSPLAADEQINTPLAKSSVAVAAETIWWTNNGAIPAPVAAYRAVSTPGSPWGAGPASLAESYVNLANPGTYNAIPGVAPVWTISGWIFTGSEYLLCGFVPNSGYSVVFRFSDTTGGNLLFGAQLDVSDTFHIGPNYFGAAYFRNSGTTFATATNDGTIGMAARIAAYINGGIVGGAFSFALGNFSQLVIGAMYPGAPYTAHCTIQAAWIADYDASAYMADLHTIMMAL